MIGNFEHLAKESTEVILRRLRRSFVGSTAGMFLPNLDEILTRGFSVVENFWSPQRCLDARKAIDNALLLDTRCKRWSDAEKADNRLYFAERVGGELESFFRDAEIESLRKRYSGVRVADKLLLAARLDFKPGNVGSGGGWHRDSPHRSQFKALIYLSDVDSVNGPFEYLEGSHKATLSLKLLALKKSKPNQYRFTDDEVMNMLDVTPKHTFVAKAGTMLLVDTKGIHRGRPIETGSRYALTLYCFDGAKPKDFLP